MVQNKMSKIDKVNVNTKKQKSSYAENANLSVLFISSECTPFAKVGGLADVVGSLPKYLSVKDCDVRVVLPFYRKIKQKYINEAVFLRSTTLKLGWRNQYSGLYMLDFEGIKYYFIDNEYYFGNDKIYIDYTFDIERFCFFQRAVLEALGEAMNFVPDILHCNDWQSGMIPCLLEAHYKSQGFFSNVKTILTIHNLKYQGIHSIETISDLLDLPSEYMSESKVLHKGDPNFLKAGIVYADFVTTVSETYANEILTSEYGEGLDNVLWANLYKIRGVVNGIDDIEYDSANDTYLPFQYDINNVFEGKSICKKKLQEEVGLEQNALVPIAGIVTRLVDQKGLDLILPVLDDILDLPMQIVILGTGDPYYENILADTASKRPAQIAACITFDNHLAHRIYAGSDMFLMPSLFEPCGLSQMISMHYGTLPIVRETGGLKDTVIPYNEYTGEGTGFSFRNINPTEFYTITKYAHETYINNRIAWNKLILNAMDTDFTWNNSARKYIEIYKEITSE